MQGIATTTEALTGTPYQYAAVVQMGALGPALDPTGAVLVSLFSLVDPIKLCVEIHSSDHFDRIPRGSLFFAEEAAWFLRDQALITFREMGRNTLLQEALQSPDSEVLVAKAQAFAAEGAEAQADKAFEHLIARHPNHAEGLLAAAAFMIDRGSTDRAFDVLYRIPEGARGDHFAFLMSELDAVQHPLKPRNLEPSFNIVERAIDLPLVNRAFDRLSEAISIGRSNNALVDRFLEAARSVTIRSDETPRFQLTFWAKAALWTGMQRGLAQDAVGMALEARSRIATLLAFRKQMNFFEGYRFGRPGDVGERELYDLLEPLTLSLGTYLLRARWVLLGEDKMPVNVAKEILEIGGTFLDAEMWSSHAAKVIEEPGILSAAEARQIVALFQQQLTDSGLDARESMWLMKMLSPGVS